MSLRPAPEYEQRTSREILAELRERLDLVGDRNSPMAEALLAVFAHYCGLIIERLNRAPDRLLLAFLNELGVAPRPPVPAQASISFTPVRHLPSHGAMVPKGTAVAAAPKPGETEPVVFETERALLLTGASLVSAVAVDPARDSYADHAGALVAGGETAALFGVDRPLKHELLIGHEEAFAGPPISRLSLQFSMAGMVGGQPVGWYIRTPEGSLPLHPVADTTQAMSRSGEVVFEGLPEWPIAEAYGQRGRWIECRPRGSLRRQGPWLRGIALRLERVIEDAEVQAAFAGRVPVEVGTDFFPLGERPRFGDAFYLASEAFARSGIRVHLLIELTNPAGGDPETLPVPPVATRGEPQLRWESWDGRRWSPLAVEQDGTSRLSQSGVVVLQMPVGTKPVEVNGAEGSWIRARLTGGNYGEEERWEVAGTSVRRIPNTFAPPVIATLSVRVEEVWGPVPPQALLACNGPCYRELDPGLPQSVAAFTTEEEGRRALYMGFRAPAAGVVLGGRSFDLQVDPGVPEGRFWAEAASVQAATGPAWGYWNGVEWRPCGVEDSTEAWQSAGLARLSPGEDWAPWQQCALVPDPSGVYWLRALWEPLSSRLGLRSLRLNTVAASHVLTLENELLGASSGLPHQRFRVARAPILDQVELEVFEGDQVAPNELSASPVSTLSRRPPVSRKRQARGEWVGWREVDDFLTSTAEDRHFTVDRLRGEIQFGDGVRGRIPPLGSSNVRLRRYRTAGGSAGNCPPGSLTMLRTTVPFVTAVDNPHPALGGADAEDWAQISERGARLLRHRRRAVTVEDYEDLARLAAPTIARARSYPLKDLAADPDGRREAPGVISVVVVTASTEPAPRPAMKVLRQVRDHLIQHAPPGIRLVVLAPEYLDVVMETEVVATAEAPADLAARCERQVVGFLHPLTGGENNEGWQFGDRPRRSDLYAALERVPGVDHVRTLRFHFRETRPGLIDSGAFLLAPGRLQVRVAAGAGQ